MSGFKNTYNSYILSVQIFPKAIIEVTTKPCSNVKILCYINESLDGEASSLIAKTHISAIHCRVIWYFFYK